MAKRKRCIKGRVYIINDSLVSRDAYSKPGRRVVAINNKKDEVHIVKIKADLMTKTNARLNKWDMDKIEHLK